MNGRPAMLVTGGAKRIGAAIARAFAAGVAASAARTSTDGQAMFLHGNLIAKREADGSVWVTLAGWGTVTTRDRVNTLCHVLGSGVRFYQRNHVQRGCLFCPCPIGGPLRRSPALYGRPSGRSLRYRQ